MTLKKIQDKAKGIEKTWKSKQRAAKKDLADGIISRKIPLADVIQEADQIFFLKMFIDDLVKLVDHRRKRLRKLLDTEATYDGVCLNLESEVAEWEKEDGTGKDSQGS